MIKEVAMIYIPEFSGYPKCSFTTTTNVTDDTPNMVIFIEHDWREPVVIL